MGFKFDESGFDDLIDDLQNFDIECPECGKDIEVSIDDIGKSVNCPHCKTIIEIESE